MGVPYERGELLMTAGPPLVHFQSVSLVATSSAITTSHITIHSVAIPAFGHSHLLYKRHIHGRWTVQRIAQTAPQPFPHFASPTHVRTSHSSVRTDIGEWPPNHNLTLDHVSVWGRRRARLRPRMIICWTRVTGPRRNGTRLQSSLRRCARAMR